MINDYLVRCDAPKNILSHKGTTDIHYSLLIIHLAAATAAFSPPMEQVPLN